MPWRKEAGNGIRYARGGGDQFSKVRLLVRQYWIRELQEGREKTMQVSRGGASRQKGTATGKAPRQKHAAWVEGIFGNCMAEPSVGRVTGRSGIQDGSGAVVRVALSN